MLVDAVNVVKVVHDRLVQVDDTEEQTVEQVDCEEHV